MRVLSVTSAFRARSSWRGKPVTTGIFKEPVAGPVPIRTLNFDGDRQADLPGPRWPGQGRLRLPVRVLRALAKRATGVPPPSHGGSSART